MVVDARAADDAARRRRRTSRRARGTALDGSVRRRRNRRRRDTSSFSKWRAGRSFDRRSFDTRTTRATRAAPFTAEEARASLVDAVGSVWSRAVVEGPRTPSGVRGSSPTALPAAVRLGRDEGTNTRRCLCQHIGSFPRRRSWGCVRSLGFCGSSNTAIRRGGARDSRDSRGRVANPAGDGPVATALAGVESELAPFFARVPPPPSDPTAPREPARLGPFSRVPPRCQAAAVELLGALPALSPATLRAVAHATLAPGADPRLATRATEAIACNAAAAPLALTVSFLATALAGASSWAAAKEVAPRRARALAQMGDPWLGASLAAPAVDIARRRAERAGDVEGARRATYGAIVAAVVAAESRLVPWMCRKTSRRPSREPSRTRSRTEARGRARRRETTRTETRTETRARWRRGWRARATATRRAEMDQTGVCRASPTRGEAAAEETSTERSRRRARRRRRRNWRREGGRTTTREGAPRGVRRRRGVRRGGDGRGGRSRARRAGPARAAKAARLATLAVEAFAEAAYDAPVDANA